jgi:hypothetical protein
MTVGEHQNNVTNKNFLEALLENHHIYLLMGEVIVQLFE